MEICAFILIIIASIFKDTFCLKLNLTAECADTHIYFCTLAHVATSLLDPLVIVNSSASQLSELIFRNSIIGWLPKEVFVQAPNLHALFMHECELNRLNIEDFEHARKLQKLMLQSNRLSELPERIFSSAYALQELHLADNHIHLMHGKAFAALEHLHFLDLNRNSLHELPRGVFADLINLEYIDLSNNELERIDGQTFLHNSKLRTVLLSDNKFAVFESDALQHLTHLHLVDLSYSYLQELSLQSVDTLLVQSTGLKRCTIKQSVIKLRASNNLLDGLSIGDKLSVRELELHGNLFNTLDDFIGMLNLQKLDISKNKLTSLRTSRAPLYLPLPSLTNFNLASNQLQNLSTESFLTLRKLAHLDLAFNHLTRLDQSVFEPLSNLEKLYIEGNRLRRFDYEQLTRSHVQLKELGIFNNDWDFPYMRAMIAFLKEGAINLPIRFGLSEISETLPTMEHHGAKSNSGDGGPHHRYATAGVFMGQVGEGSGIHPYWTTRDILALTTLIIVLLILLLQFFKILQEENCFAACRSRLRGEDGHVGIGGRNRPSRLAEEDSEV